MERLRVYIGWTVPVGLLLRKLTYTEAQAATPFIVAVVLWAAYLLVDFVGHYSFGADYNQLGQQVSGKAFDPLVMDRRARRARPPRHARHARPPRPPAYAPTRRRPRSCGGAHAPARCALRHGLRARRARYICPKAQRGTGKTAALTTALIAKRDGTDMATQQHRRHRHGHHGHHHGHHHHHAHHHGHHGHGHHGHGDHHGHGHGHGDHHGHHHHPHHHHHHHGQNGAAAPVAPARHDSATIWGIAVTLTDADDPSKVVSRAVSTIQRAARARQARRRAGGEQAGGPGSSAGGCVRQESAGGRVPATGERRRRRSSAASSVASSAATSTPGAERHHRSSSSGGARHRSPGAEPGERRRSSRRRSSHHGSSHHGSSHHDSSHHGASHRGSSHHGSSHGGSSHGGSSHGGSTTRRRHRHGHGHGHGHGEGHGEGHGHGHGHGHGEGHGEGRRPSSRTASDTASAGARGVPEVHTGSDCGGSHVAHPDGHSPPRVRHLSQVRRLPMTASVADFYANLPPQDQPEPPERVQVAQPARQRRRHPSGSEASSSARSNFAV